MADIFLMLGIMVSVIMADAIVCLGLTLFVEKELDDDLYLLPSLLVNSIGFVIVSAFSIYRTIAR